MSFMFHGTGRAWGQVAFSYASRGRFPERRVRTLGHEIAVCDAVVAAVMAIGGIGIENSFWAYGYDQHLVDAC
jgi:hypothetical protein